MAKVPKSFADDFAVSSRYWRATGDTDADINDIRAAARADFEANRNLIEWADWIREIANFQRDLDAMAAGINDRAQPQVIAMAA